MDIGLIGAIFGTTIGVLGAAFGTYCGIKSTKTLAERKFVIKYAIGMWLAGILLMGLPIVLALIGIIPVWLYWVMWALFFILLVLSIFWVNKRQTALRDEKE